MALEDFLGPSGGGAGNWQAVSPLVIPEIAALFNRAQEAVPQPGQLQGMSDFIGAGMNSPLLQMILEPAMTRLRSGFGDQRDAMADQFRQAGALRSSQYLNRAIPKLSGEQSMAEGSLISDLTMKSLQPILQGLFQQQNQAFMPAQSYADILKAVRPDIQFSNPVNVGSGGGGSIGEGRSMANNPFFTGSGGGSSSLSSGWGAATPGAPYNTNTNPFGGSGGGDNWTGAYQPTPAEATEYYGSGWWNPGFQIPFGNQGSNNMGGAGTGITQNQFGGYTSTPMPYAYSNPFADFENTDWGYLNPGQLFS